MKGIRLTGTPLYLDMQATTPIDPRVLDSMLPYMVDKYGNPHSRTHAYGWETEDSVEVARKEVRLLLLAFNTCDTAHRLLLRTATQKFPLCATSLKRDGLVLKVYIFSLLASSLSNLSKQGGSTRVSRGSITIFAQEYAVPYGAYWVYLTAVLSSPLRSSSKCKSPVVILKFSLRLEAIVFSLHRGIYSVGPNLTLAASKAYFSYAKTCTGCQSDWS